MSAARRYDYVDLLRGLAAVAVLVYHYQWFFARSPGDFRHISETWIFGYGYLAVQLFWVLSGFVFAIAYGRFGKELSVRTFFVHRVARLYPLHLATLLLVGSLQWLSLIHFGEWQVYPNNTPGYFLLHLFMASNWLTMDFSFNAPIWSVSIEVLIYFVFLAYLKKVGLSLFVAVVLALWFGAIEHLTHNLVAQCGALFFIGVSMAIVSRNIGRAILPAASAILAVIAGILATAWKLKGGAPLGLMIYGLLPALLFFFVALDRWFTLPKQFHWIGLSTYSIYLLHMPVLIGLRMTVGIVPLWLFVGLVIGLSVLSYRFIEAPAQAKIRQLSQPSGRLSLPLR